MLLAVANMANENEIEFVLDLLWRCRAVFRQEDETELMSREIGKTGLKREIGIRCGFSQSRIEQFANRSNPHRIDLYDTGHFKLVEFLVKWAGRSAVYGRGDLDRLLKFLQAGPTHGAQLISIYQHNRPHQHPTPSPRTWAELLAQDQIDGLIRRAHGQLNSTEARLGRILDYKHAHDQLQRIEVQQHVIVALMNSMDASGSSAATLWNGLSATLKAHWYSISETCSYIRNTPLMDEASHWVERLESSAEQLMTALAGHDMNSLDQLLNDIDMTYSVYMTTVNGQLLSHLSQFLSDSELFDTLSALSSNLNEYRDGLDRTGTAQIETFAAAWAQVLETLQALRHTRELHKQLQLITDHWRADMTRVTGDFDGFRRSWRMIHQPQVRHLCASLDGKWAAEFLDLIAQLEEWLETGDASLVVDGFQRCREHAAIIFVQIDHRLMKLCNSLYRSELRKPLDCVKFSKD